VIDADGRRVSFMGLIGGGGAGSMPADVAPWLTRSLESKSREWFHLTLSPGAGPKADAFSEFLRKHEGVQAVEKSGEKLLVKAAPGALPLVKILEEAKKRGVGVAFRDPILVTFTPKVKKEGMNLAKSIAPVPGVWSVSGEAPHRALISRFMMHPVTLGKTAADWAPDVEARNYALPQVSGGRAATRAAGVILKLPGALTLFPAFFSDEATVVGRKGKIAWPAVLKAFRDLGIQASEKR
jgi:hypothetical protein